MADSTDDDPARATARKASNGSDDLPRLPTSVAVEKNDIDNPIGAVPYT